jgi:hypothetical protein
MKCLYQDTLDSLPVGGGTGVEVWCGNKVESKRDCRGCERRDEALWWKKEQKARKVMAEDGEVKK